jgi:hypothetical protein
MMLIVNMTCHVLRLLNPVMSKMEKKKTKKLEAVFAAVEVSLAASPMTVCILVHST